MTPLCIDPMETCEEAREVVLGELDAKLCTSAESPGPSPVSVNSGLLIRNSAEHVWAADTFERTQNDVDGGNQSHIEPHVKSCPPSSSQKLESLAGEERAVVGESSKLQGKTKLMQQNLDMVLKLWDLDKERLEKDLFDTSRAHKLSVGRSAYDLAKLEVSFGLLKQQESLRKQQLEDAQDLMEGLQAKVKDLEIQLNQTAAENKSLTAELFTTRSKYVFQISENEDLRRAFESAKSELHKKIEDSLSAETQLKTTSYRLEKLTREMDALITQHELKIKELQELKVTMADSEGLVTDPRVLERLTSENEALHRTVTSANSEVLELKQKLADAEGLAAELRTSKLELEQVTKEKGELRIQFESAKTEIQLRKMKVAETEKLGAELIKSVQNAEELHLENINLMGQLEVLRGELEKEKEAVGTAQTYARKVMEAEHECAKALKVVEEKEEEIEYFARQLEILREKNGMLRTQLDMEQLCKEAELQMVETPAIYPESRDMPSRNLKEAMELAATSTARKIQKSPHESTLLHSRGRSRKGTSVTTTIQILPDEQFAEVPDGKADAAVQQSTKVSKKQSLGSRTRSRNQQPLESGFVTPGATKMVNKMMKSKSHEDTGVNDENTQAMKENQTRQKRPALPLPSEMETSKKRQQKKSSNNSRKSMTLDTNAALAPAQLLIASSNQPQKNKNMPHLRATPRSSFRLPSSKKFLASLEDLILQGTYSASTPVRQSTVLAHWLIR